MECEVLKDTFLHYILFVVIIFYDQFYRSFSRELFFSMHLLPVVEEYPDQTLVALVASQTTVKAGVVS